MANNDLDGQSKEEAKNEKRIQKELSKANKTAKKEAKKEEKRKLKVKKNATKEGTTLADRLVFLFTGKVPEGRKKEDLVSKVTRFDVIKFSIVAFFGLLALGLVGWGIYSLDDNNTRAPFTDNNLNYSVKIPTYWEQNTDVDYEEISEKIVKATNGVSFDYDVHELTGDVLSFSAFVYPEDTKSPVVKKILTISANGETNIPLDNQVRLMNDLKNNLTGISIKNVHVDYVKDKEWKKGNIGVLAKATGVMNKVKINFYQYNLPVGKNVMVFTYGNSTKRDGLEDLKVIVESFERKTPQEGVYYESILDGDSSSTDSTSDKEESK